MKINAKTLFFFAFCLTLLVYLCKTLKQLHLMDTEVTLYDIFLVLQNHSNNASLFMDISVKHVFPMFCITRSFWSTIQCNAVSANISYTPRLLLKLLLSKTVLIPNIISLVIYCQKYQMLKCYISLLLYTCICKQLIEAARDTRFNTGQLWINMSHDKSFQHEILSRCERSHYVVLDFPCYYLQGICPPATMFAVWTNNTPTIQ